MKLEVPDAKGNVGEVCLGYDELKPCPNFVCGLLLLLLLLLLLVVVVVVVVVLRQVPGLDHKSLFWCSLLEYLSKQCELTVFFFVSQTKTRVPERPTCVNISSILFT